MATQESSKQTRTSGQPLIPEDSVLARLPRLTTAAPATIETTPPITAENQDQPGNLDLAPGRGASGFLENIDLRGVIDKFKGKLTGGNLNTTPASHLRINENNTLVFREQVDNLVWRIEDGIIQEGEINPAELVNSPNRRRNDASIGPKPGKYKFGHEEGGWRGLGKHVDITVYEEPKVEPYKPSILYKYYKDPSKAAAEAWKEQQEHNIALAKAGVNLIHHSERKWIVRILTGKGLDDLMNP